MSIVLLYNFLCSCKTIAPLPPFQEPWCLISSLFLTQMYPSIGTRHRLWVCFYGCNIGIIAGLFTLAFSRLLGRRWGAIAAILGIVFYTVLMGASTSVLRAAIMGGSALFARQLPPRTRKGCPRPRRWRCCRATLSCAPTAMGGSI